MHLNLAKTRKITL